MKRLSILACAVSVVLAGCNGKITPVAPTGVTTLVAQLSAAGVVPPPAGGETLGGGSVTFRLTPTTGGYAVSYTLAVGNMPPTTVLAAGVIYAGGPGALPLSPVYATTISAIAPVLTPTGAIRLDFLTNPVLTQAAADQILASPSSFFFQLHSQANPNGSLRGQLVKQ